MELRQSFFLFKRRLRLSLIIFTLIVGGTFAWAYGQPPHYTTSLSLSVNRVNKESTSDYQYDGFYALQAADLFAQTVVSWLQAPPVLVEIYEQAGLTPPTVGSLRRLTTRFKTKKYSAQNIVVTYSSATADEASKLAAELTKNMQQRAEAANRTADGKTIFEIQSTKPVIIRAQPNPLLLGAVSVLVAVTLLLFLVPLVEYLATAPPLQR
ncbi:MAG: hypothetical protein HY420_04895 [Candidatus Kerfeldbacteria bacterium]|nr:hypothetical protein [Candidatus Kerfeldbacteria bacterium]